MVKRIVNVNFTCEGLRFDAAIDCDNALRESLFMKYLPEEISEYRTNIELYCFDIPQWGVRFIHYEGEPGVVVNDKASDVFGHYHTVCDMDEIMKAAHEWIAEEYSKQDAPFVGKPWFEACCKDCKYRRQILSVGATYCFVLYTMKKAETNCGKVKEWRKAYQTSSQGSISCTSGETVSTSE